MLLTTIVKNEWRLLVRNRAFLWILIILFLTSLFALAYSANKVADQQHSLQEASNQMRENFTGQGEKNPHSAAHYGHYVFKPISTLGLFDNGVNEYTGVSLYLEGHRQNEAMFAPSQTSTSMARFGNLTLSLLLQILLPLFIIFCCHNAITKEREASTMVMQFTQGSSTSAMIWGKILSYFSIWMGLLTTITLLTIAWSAIAGLTINASQLFMLWVLYSLYYFIITAVSVIVSAKSRRSGSALLKLLFAWLICVVLLPKISANIGDSTDPLISKIEMEERIANDKKNGIDGHDPASERSQAFKDSILKVYKVSSPDSLPINMDGLRMQADEEYNNIVFDKHFGSVEQVIAAQNIATSASSFINPFSAVAAISQSIAGTSVYHHFHFLHEAEQYRRIIIKKMNDEQAFGGSKTGDWDWTVDEKFWSTIPDFNYHPPTLTQSLSQVKSQILAVALWIIGILITISLISKRISTI